MNISRTLIGTLGALTLATTGGCFDLGSGTADVIFDFVILENDGAGGLIAPDCDLALGGLNGGVDVIRFLVGDDLDGNGILDDNEVQEQAGVACNQFDNNLDGQLDVAEFGLYGPITFSADFFDIFAVQIEDFNGNLIGWQTFDNNVNATRFSFGGGLDLFRGEDLINDVQFDGLNQQSDAELQIFLGF